MSTVGGAARGARLVRLRPAVRSRAQPASFEPRSVGVPKVSPKAPKVGARARLPPNFIESCPPLGVFLLFFKVSLAHGPDQTRTSRQPTASSAAPVVPVRHRSCLRLSRGRRPRLFRKMAQAKAGGGPRALPALQYASADKVRRGTAERQRHAWSAPNFGCPRRSLKNCFNSLAASSPHTPTATSSIMWNGCGSAAKSIHVPHAPRRRSGAA
jgi:hypothetical protein